MKTAPEYSLARSLIAYLKNQEGLAPLVLCEPWNSKEQVDAIAAAATAYDFTVAVAPQAPRMLPAETDTTGGLQAVLAVFIITTRQVSDPEHLAALSARVIRHVLDWTPEESGIPYKTPRLLALHEVGFEDVNPLKNMAGTLIQIGHKVNYRIYFQSK